MLDTTHDSATCLSQLEPCVGVSSSRARWALRAILIASGRVMSDILIMEDYLMLRCLLGDDEGFPERAPRT
jgi:hypothetical protein